jgi:hypothetical protein
MQAGKTVEATLPAKLNFEIKAEEELRPIGTFWNVMGS